MFPEVVQLEEYCGLLDNASRIVIILLVLNVLYYSFKDLLASDKTPVEQELGMDSGKSGYGHFVDLEEECDCGAFNQALQSGELGRFDSRK